MDVAAAWDTLCKLLDEALELHQEARAAWLERQTASEPERASLPLELLAAHGEALAVAGEAAPFWRGFDASHRDGGVALLWLARVHAALGDAEQAQAALREACEWLAGDPLPGDETLLEQARNEVEAVMA